MEQPRPRQSGSLWIQTLKLQKGVDHVTVIHVQLDSDTCRLRLHCLCKSLYMDRKEQSMASSLQSELQKTSQDCLPYLPSTCAHPCMRICFTRYGTCFSSNAPPDLTDTRRSVLFKAKHLHRLLPNVPAGNPLSFLHRRLCFLFLHPLQRWNLLWLDRCVCTD